jgi:hypothetical protein
LSELIDQRMMQRAIIDSDDLLLVIIETQLRLFERSGCDCQRRRDIARTAVSVHQGITA